MLTQGHTAEQVVSMNISKEESNSLHLIYKSWFRAHILRNSLVRLFHIPTKSGERTRGKLIRFPDLINLKSDCNYYWRQNFLAKINICLHKQCLAILILIETSRNLDDISSGQRALNFLRPWGSCSLVHPPKRWAYNSRARKSFDHYFTDKLEIISVCVYLDATSTCIYISSFMLRSPYLPNTMESTCYWVFLATSCWDNWGHYQSTDGAFSPKVAWVINCPAAYLILFS